MNEPLSLTPQQVKQLLDSLHEFHENYGALETLLTGQSEKLILDAFNHFLRVFPNEDQRDDGAPETLARAYHHNNVPFALLMGCFNHTKEALIQLLSADLEEPADHFSTINHWFEWGKQNTARHYMLLETRRLSPIPEAAIREKVLIQCYVQWMEEINHAIQHDLERFPLIPAQESRFAQALRYPESLLICLDLKICDLIQEQHRLIFQQASILYAMLSTGRYEQAYLAYQEIQQKVTQMFNLLGTLYFESQTNRIYRFFSFVQASLYLPGNKYFCVVNLRGMRKLNKLYGNETGDHALKIIEELLKQEFEQHQSWMIYTQGIAGDFYIMSYMADVEQVEQLLKRLEKNTREYSKQENLPVELGLQTHGISLTDLRELTTENMHHLIHYLSLHLRQPGSTTNTIENTPEQAENMLRWMREQYHKSLNLRNMLSEKAVDIFVQPLVTLDDQRCIHAFEVLGRFRQEDGYISAGIFIDDIVSMGLVAEFDKLILGAIVHQAEGLAQITDRLFINASAHSLENETYIRALVEAMNGPLQPFEVVIELTEQILLNSIELVYRLHNEHGLNFAIDDFGTGYASLQTVIELALRGGIKYLKIDGSLVRTLTTNKASEQIIRITRQMAQELNLRTVVEYVETTGQLDKLVGMELDFGQGYLLGVPDPVPVWQGKLNYIKSKQGSNEAIFPGLI